MKEIANDKIKEYLKELELSNKLDDQDCLDVENINLKITQLNDKLKYYDALESIMDETGKNEINFTDNDAKTVKFGAHQRTDLRYNIHVVIDSKKQINNYF